MNKYNDKVLETHRWGKHKDGSFMYIEMWSEGIDPKELHFHHMGNAEWAYEEDFIIFARNQEDLETHIGAGYCFNEYDVVRFKSIFKHLRYGKMTVGTSPDSWYTHVWLNRTDKWTVLETRWLKKVKSKKEKKDES